MRFRRLNSQRSSNALSGFHGGGTAGYNFQYGQVVFGVEGDFSGANIRGKRRLFELAGFVIANATTNAGCHAKMTWFGTGTARLGLTVDRALIFIKGGGAWAHFDESATANDVLSLGGGALVVGAPGSLTSTRSGTRGGFTFGTGVEYALGSNLSAKVEYDYMDFSANNVTYVFAGPRFGPGTTANLGVDEHQRIHLVKAGLNYRFNYWH